MTNKLKNIDIEKLKSMNTDEIKAAANNIREFLIDSNSKTGGHIGANLGTVELSLALHYVFNSPNDAIVWDTGHTGYTHKILTGRAKNFSTLNTYGGMNRFISSSESEHDFIEASHAGTSISVALGRAISLRNSGKDHWSIAVIGDGALAEGVALEALNHASVEKNIRLMIVLNDNGYAISPGFGAIHEYLQSRPIEGDHPDTLFTSLGYKAIGPIDGHSITSLVSVFNKVTESDKVCLVHIKTEKGHGLAPATNHDFKMHYSFPFDPITGKPTVSLPTLGYQDIASMAIEDCMMKNPDIVAITPSTLYATGLSKVFETFPDRCFDPGMEEQHAVSMAVGMALSGSRPVLFYQSTFLQRAFDQIIHDVCFSNQDILILSVRSGFAGYDNPTHHGIYDFSYLRGVPNLNTYYPKDSHELYEMVFLALTKLSGPVLIHMPYGPADDTDYIRGKADLEMESPEQICTGSDGVIITIGNKVKECKLAIDSLSKKGLYFGLVNVRKLKPLPDDQLIQMIGDLGKVVTVEESVLEGGFGSAVSSMLHQHSMNNELLQIGLPCSFIEGGSNEELSSIYGVDSKGIARQIFERWEKDSE
jgi:1-deoxy-D-xylulose-5-phosphate synthase